MLNSKLSIFCFNYVHSFYHTKHSYHATESVRGCSQKPTPAWCTTVWSIISSVVSSVKCTLVVIFNILFSIWYKSHHSSWMPVTTISCFRVCGRFFKPETQNWKKNHKKEKMVKKIRNEIISLLCLRVFALQILEGEINAFGVRNS